MQLTPKEMTSKVYYEERDGWYFIHTFGYGHHNLIEKIGKKFAFFHYEGIKYVDSHELESTDIKPHDQGCRRNILGMTLFIRGNHIEISDYLKSIGFDRGLAIDRATRKAAYIADSEMSLFRLLAQDRRSFFFSVNDSSFYSIGNDLIRVTSGIMKGLEGYIIRFSRDRKLVVKIENKVIVFEHGFREEKERVDEYSGIAEQLLKGQNLFTLALEEQRDLLDIVSAPVSMDVLLKISHILRSSVSKIRLFLEKKEWFETAKLMTRNLLKDIYRYSNKHLSSTEKGDYVRYLRKEFIKISKDLWDEYLNHIEPCDQLFEMHRIFVSILKSCPDLSPAVKYIEESIIVSQLKC